MDRYKKMMLISLMKYLIIITVVGAGLFYGGRRSGFETGCQKVLGTSENLTGLMEKYCYGASDLFQEAEAARAAKATKVAAAKVQIKVAAIAKTNTKLKGTAKTEH